MEDKYIWDTQYKRAGWKRFSEGWPSESEQVAKDYIGHFHPGLTWFTTTSSGPNVQFARRLIEPGEYMTYRLTRRTVITQADVDEHRKAREAKNERNVS
jgi:hypothetical protein